LFPTNLWMQSTVKLLTCKFYNEWRQALIVFTIKALLVTIKKKLHTLQEIYAKNSSATLGILSFIEFQNFLPCSHETIMSQNPIHILTPYIFKILFNIIIQSMSGSSKGPLSFRFSHLYYAKYIPNPPDMSWFAHPDNYSSHNSLSYNTMQYNLFAVHKS